MSGRDDGWLYLIGDLEGAAVKVGYSNNPRGRLATLQTGNPHRLRLVGTWQATRRLERTLHRVLRRHGLGGEWYDPLGLRCLVNALMHVDPDVPMTDHEELVMCYAGAMDFKEEP